MVSNKAKQEMLRMETYAMFPYLIEVTLASGEVLRYANCDEDITFSDDGEEKIFEAGYFKVKVPDITQSEIGNGTLSISAVDTQWIKRIREERKTAKIRFVASIAYTDEMNVETVEAIEDMEFMLKNATWDDTVISWTMVFDEGLSVNVPCDIATPNKCPACA